MEWGKTLGRAAWDLEALPGAPVKASWGKRLFRVAQRMGFSELEAWVAAGSKL